MTHSHDAQHAVVLFGHGSRDPLWRAPIEAVAERMRQIAPHIETRCAYLELSEPILPTAAAKRIGASPFVKLGETATPAR